MCLRLVSVRTFSQEMSNAGASAELQHATHTPMQRQSFQALVNGSRLRNFSSRVLLVAEAQAVLLFVSGVDGPWPIPYHSSCDSLGILVSPMAVEFASYIRLVGNVCLPCSLELGETMWKSCLREASRQDCFTEWLCGVAASLREPHKCLLEFQKKLKPCV